MQVNMTKMSTQKSTDDMIYNIKSAYYDYLYAIDNVQLKSELLQRYKEKQSLTERLYASGLCPVLDVSRANVKVVEAMLEHERARNSERLAKSALYMSIGITESDLPNLKPMQVDDMPKLKYSLEELTQLALMYNPDVQIVDYDIKVKQKRISVARALNDPSVDMEFGIGFQNKSCWGMDSNNEFMNIFKFDKWTPTFFGSFVAAIPVYTGGAISGRTDVAVSEYNKSVYKGREVIMNVKNQVQVLFQSLNELENQINISKMVVEDSQKYVLLARRSYENGEGSLLDVNEAEANAIQATLGSYSIKYKYLLTFASIAKLIGVSEEQICLN
jgi:multidrug efflux system outer membrane protein